MAKVAQLVEQRFVAPSVASSILVFCPILLCPHGGIGRRGRLKIYCRETYRFESD